MSWGASFRSCDALLRRIEENDPKLTDLVILPTKSFGEKDLGRLAKVLESGSNTHWRSLSASSHKISPAALLKFGKSIASNKNQQLVELAIGGSEMGDDGVCSLCDGLTSNDVTSPSIEKLDLSYKGIGNKGFLSVVKALGGSRRLRQLNLSRNVGIGGCLSALDTSDNEEKLPPADLQEELFPFVSHLDLSDCSIDDVFISQFCPRLASAERKLKLSVNPLAESGFRALLNSTDWIQELRLSNCDLGNESMHTLVTSKKLEWTNLKVLDVSDNGITTEGARDLSSCIAGKDDAPYLTGLRELNLSKNPLGSDGIELIVDGIHRRSEAGFPRLDALDLSETKCDVKGAVAAVSRSSATNLVLYSNSLRSDGFRKLAGSLRAGHPHIVTLDLAGNRADQASVVELLDSLMAEAGGDQEDNSVVSFESKLRTLVIGGNETGDLVESAVLRVMQIQPNLDIPRDKVRKQ